MSPPDLKIGVADRINELLAPIREEFEKNEEFQLAQKNGYPVEQPKQEKKVKKPKNKGTKYPGGGNQTGNVDAKSEADVAATAKVLKKR